MLNFIYTALLSRKYSNIDAKMFTFSTRKQGYLLASLFFLSANATVNPLEARLDNGLALTPPMGYAFPAATSSYS
jgi:hypothetical protein